LAAVREVDSIRLPLTYPHHTIRSKLEKWAKVAANANFSLLVRSDQLAMLRIEVCPSL
jgi:hypothetical protein